MGRPRHGYIWAWTCRHMSRIERSRGNQRACRNRRQAGRRRVDLAGDVCDPCAYALGLRRELSIDDVAPVRRLF